ncbi:MAG TPA: NUDIX domain-containing protein [Patescibacteria group bacterium]|jgi:8-oxo-dGTP pyrophosphatase MutT (NUDIX family)|nr:NUDIX domain-containing protein [Patescibacteria group bacterium]
MVIRGAKALVLDAADNALILRRSKTHPYVPFSQDLPGGKVEEGETMLEGLLRELREETSIELEPDQPARVASANVENYFGKNYYLELFVVHTDRRPSIVLDFEHDQADWISLGQINLVEEDRYRSLIAEFIAERAA